MSNGKGAVNQLAGNDSAMDLAVVDEFQRLQSIRTQEGDVAWASAVGYTAASSLSDRYDVHRTGDQKLASRQVLHALLESLNEIDPNPALSFAFVDGVVSYIRGRFSEAYPAGVSDEIRARAETKISGSEKGLMSKDCAWVALAEGKNMADSIIRLAAAKSGSDNAFWSQVALLRADLYDRYERFENDPDVLRRLFAKGFMFSVIDAIGLDTYYLMTRFR